MEDHSHEKHLKKLHSLCRICGLRCTSSRRKTTDTLSLVSNNTDGIMMAYGVNVKNDNPECHSRHMCKTCHSRISYVRKCGISEKIIDRNRTMLIDSERLWAIYDGSIPANECTICRHDALLVRAGRPPKKSTNRRSIAGMRQLMTPIHRGTTDDTSDGPGLSELNAEDRNTTDHFHTGVDTDNPQISFTELLLGATPGNSSQDPSEFSVSLVHDFACATTSHLECEGQQGLSVTEVREMYDHTNAMPIQESEQISSIPIASNFSLLNAPSHSTQHSADMFHRFDDIHSTKSHCLQPTPSSYQQSDTRSIHPSPSLDSQNPQEGISTISSVNQSIQTPHNTTPTPVKLISTIEKVLNKPVMEPLSAVEESLHTNLVKRKLQYSKDKKTIMVKTGGQLLLFAHIPLLRKRSAKACSPLKRKRARRMKHMRQRIAGTELEDEYTQCSSELKVLPHKQRKHIFQDAGIKTKEKASKKFGLAMKSLLGLTWAQYRKCKTILKDIGVRFYNEKDERIEMEKLVPKISEKNIEGSVKFTMVYVEDLCCFATDLLNRYAAVDLLTWHDSSIPENEIWLKIGGDYGKKSFKLALEFLNLENPNSPDNTFPVLIANVKDQTNNLVAIMEHYNDQISMLQQLHWEGKRVRLFLFGDYDFVCKTYGHQGATSSHPCLWCLVRKTDVKDHTLNSPAMRTLDTIKEDNKKFIKEGESNLLKSKHFNNIIRQPLLNIPLDHIAPPYLHILLGVVKRHHDILEQKYNDLDKLIAADRASKFVTVPLGNRIFDEFVNKTINIAERKMTVEGLIAFGEFNMTNTSELDNLQNELEQLEELTEYTQNIYTDFEGPLCSELTDVLKEHKIVRQAYHSQSFVGNHCHKYLQEAFLQHLTSSIKERVVQVTNNTEIIASTVSITQEYKSVLSEFSSVHTLIAHKGQVDSQTIDKAKQHIAEYIRLFQMKYPDTTLIPKQHILEAHCPDWMLRYGFGMAMHGEQGGESLHGTLERISQAARGIRRESERLMYIMKSAIIKCSPELREKVPALKKSKK